MTTTLQIDERVKLGGTSAGRVLLYFADVTHAERLVAALQDGGLETSAVGSESDALRDIYLHHPDLVLVAGPAISEAQVRFISKVRDLCYTPILLIGDAASETVRIEAFGAGADDCLPLNVGGPELVARIEAKLRRARVPLAAADENVYRDARLTIDPSRASVVLDGRDISLTPMEFRLLLALASQPGRVLNADDLLDHCYPMEPTSVEGVRVYIGHIRKKLGDDDARMIETLRGFGYRYVAPSRG